MKSFYWVTVVLIAFVFSSASFAFGVSPKDSKFKKVVWIVFENEDYSDVTHQADFAKLQNLGASFSNFTGEVHPSQGNYIAMIAGSAFNIHSDNNINLNEKHIGDLLLPAGMDWRVYAEGYPGNCFTRAQQGKYARKHVPFLSFNSVTKNAKECAKIENESRFFSDLANGNLVEFSMYIPDLNNDGHDTSVDYAGNWLTKTFGDIFASPEKLGDVLFIITFDESSIFNSRNPIFTVLIGANIRKGFVNTQKLNHTALLKMIEDEFQLGNLSKDDSLAEPIVGIWK